MRQSRTATSAMFGATPVYGPARVFALGALCMMLGLSGCTSERVGDHGAASLESLKGGSPKTVELPGYHPDRILSDVEIADLKEQGHNLDGSTVGTQQSLDYAFRNLSADQVSTGILLEKAVSSAWSFVASADGTAKSATLSPSDFANSYGTLTRASVGAKLPSMSELRRRAVRWSDAMINPISIASVEYNEMGREAFLAMPRDKKLETFSLPPGPIGQVRHFVGATMLGDTVRSYDPTFIVPRELAVVHSRDGSKSVPANITLKIGDAPSVQVELDKPVFVEGIQCVPTYCHRPQMILPALCNDELCPPRCVDPDEMEVPFTIQFDVDDDPQETHGRVKIRCEGPPPPPPPPPPTDGGACRQCSPGLGCYDMEPVESSVPFVAPFDEPEQGDTGKLHVRIYPTNGTVECDGYKSEVSLKKPLVVVDGFDLLNVRSQRSIYSDFSGTIRKLQDWGYDVITLDYDNGRDWIQRNGLAIRTLLNERLKDWVPQEVLDRDEVVLLTGSMGTQTGRWALRSAELDNVDHNVGLFIALDGPFQGANVPISLQRMVLFIEHLVPVATDFRNGLESPAARQMLIRTYEQTGTLEIFGQTIPIFDWYVPHPAFDAYYATVNAPGFGLPRRTRNVSIINGSGTGSTLDDDPRVLLIGVHEWKTLVFPPFCRVGVTINARGDGTGQVFDGQIDMACLLDTIGSQRSAKLTLDSGLGLDVGPGGFRTTQDQIIEAFKTSPDIPAEFRDTHVESKLRTHNHEPTFSTLGVRGVPANYNPSADPNIANASPFDAVWWEKCNTEHIVGATGDSFGFLRAELVAFCEGQTPDLVQNYSEECEVGEEEDLCLGFVDWYEDPTNPVEILPTNVNNDCLVASCPPGTAGHVIDDRFYVVTPAGSRCLDGSPVQNGRCVHTTTSSSGSQPGIYQPGIFRMTFVNTTATCPARTGEVDREVAHVGGLTITTVSCRVNLPPNHDPREVTTAGRDILILAEPVCAAGIPYFIEMQPVCLLGVSPPGTTAFKDGGDFYYDGPDVSYCVPTPRDVVCWDKCLVQPDGCGGFYFCGLC